MHANDPTVLTASSTEQALDGAYSATFRERALCSGGAWSREARVVALVAQAWIAFYVAPR